MTRRTAPHRAFTLLELILVVLLLAVLAGAIAPRLAGQRTRTLRQEADGLARLLSAAAQRDALSSERIALYYTEESGSVALLRYQHDADPAGWFVDDLVSPAPLVRLELVEAVAAQRTLDDEQWLVEFPPDTSRPELAFLLRDPADDTAWQVGLGGFSASASIERTDGRRRIEIGPSDSIDLDAIGEGAQPW